MNLYEEKLRKEDIDKSFSRLNISLIDILDQPRILEYNPDSNGFYLYSDDLSLRFTKRSCFENENNFSLWIKDETPYIEFQASFINPKRSETISCNSICFALDDNCFFTLLEEETLENLGNCLSFGPSDISILNGKYSIDPEFFDLGTNVLRRASENLNLPLHYNNWHNEFEPNLLQKLAKYVRS